MNCLLDKLIIFQEYVTHCDKMGQVGLVAFASSVNQDRTEHSRRLIEVFNVRHSVRETFRMHLENSFDPFGTPY